MRKRTRDMRTKQDIIEACERHVDDAVDQIVKKDLRAIPTVIRVYWQSDLAMEMISNSNLREEKILRLVVQEVIPGKSDQLKEHLFQLGQRIFSGKRPKGISPMAMPTAISISCCAILANSITDKNEDFRKVSGFPALLVAGRTANGKSDYKLLPVAFANKTDSFVFGLPYSQEIEEKIREVKSLPQADFCLPFFEGCEAVAK